MMWNKLYFQILVCVLDFASKSQIEFEILPKHFYVSTDVK